MYITDSQPFRLDSTSCVLRIHFNYKCGLYSAHKLMKVSLMAELYLCNHLYVPVCDHSLPVLLCLVAGSFGKTFQGEYETKIYLCVCVKVHVLK